MDGKKLTMQEGSWTGLSTLNDGKFTIQMKGEPFQVTTGEEKEQRTVLIKPAMIDDTSVRLPLGGSNASTAATKLKLSGKEREHAEEIFSLWLSPDGSRKTSQENHLKIDSAMHGLTESSELHGLHRLFWAIFSNRPRLAQVLMYRNDDPIVAGFFGAFCYKTIPAKEANKVVKEKFLPQPMALCCEQYSVDILCSLVVDGDAVFEEFVYWSEESEEKADFQRFLPKMADRQRNFMKRTALRSMGFGRNDEVTHLDLAIAADSKIFMGDAQVPNSAPETAPLARTRTCPFDDVP